VLNEFKFDPNAYYLPAYPTDVVLPEYLDALRQPLVYLGEDFNGKPSLDEMTQGKFISQKTAGVFAASPGAGLMAQMERQLQLDFGQISLPELLTVLPRSLTDGLNLARTVDMTQTEDGIAFKASGIVYESLYRTPTPPRSVAVLGCPVVSAVASALAKATGKTVTLNDQAQTRNCGANLTFKFLGENPS
jgi:hypothetical protein